MQSHYEGESGARIDHDCTFTVLGNGWIDVDNLVVKEVTVDQGASMWRIRARAQGRAAWIQHRTSHIQVVLNEE